MEIKEIQDHLDNIRTSKDLWNEFAYVKNEEAYFEDENYLKRYALAIELQYHWTPDDQELVRFLMKNEVESQWYDGWQGIGPSLVLISYLLTKSKNPENVWLFEEAKWANFDTYCGYDSEFIFSAGVAATCKYLENHEISEEDHPYLFKMKDELQTIYTEKEIDEFLKE
ncbi:hypothetical protein [Hazenella coriacea]|uniref:DUF4240 domain-containing protein n=1 Tax=Hazenella coriacea TaxID=1179467 RepID=A0A4V2UVH1_9BACL|nr:hypothetical protein [Hazenella coriacea]TCS95747.1 hypothetical protein EDD58_102327 [Hazenella coriacea]